MAYLTSCACENVSASHRLTMTGVFKHHTYDHNIVQVKKRRKQTVKFNAVIKFQDNDTTLSVYITKVCHGHWLVVFNFKML